MNDAICVIQQTLATTNVIVSAASTFCGLREGLEAPTSRFCRR
jgi:hypothetical protein